MCKRSVRGIEAEALTEEQDRPVDFSVLRDVLFEDLDFEFLYDETYDGIEEADLGELMGITHLPFAEWFERFGPPASSAYTEVCPYAQQLADAMLDMPST